MFYARVLKFNRSLLLLFKIGFDQSIIMAEDSEKLLYRMQNIIPRGLSSTSQNIIATPTLTTAIEKAALDGPQDFVIEMTFGKIAGTFLSKTIDCFLVLDCFCVLTFYNA